MIGKTFDYIIVDELDDMIHKKLEVRFDPSTIQSINEMKTRIAGIVQNAMQDPLMPDELVQLIKYKGIVTGGISASVYHDEQVNDIDIYLKDDQAIKLFASIMEMRNVTKTIVKDVNPNYHGQTLVSGKVVTANATTLFNDVQIITMGTSSMIDSFDFIHCKPFLDLETNKYYISPLQYKSITSKTLMRNGEIPTTFGRIDKFKGRGWKLSEL